MDCDTLFCAPRGPSTPFGGPYSAVIDSARLTTVDEPARGGG